MREVNEGGCPSECRSRNWSERETSRVAAGVVGIVYLLHCHVYGGRE